MTSDRGAGVPVSDEAVEAAVEAWDRTHIRIRFEQRMRLTLEAAAPFMVRDAVTVAVAAERERIAVAIEAEAESKQARLGTGDRTGLVGNWVNGLREAAVIARKTGDHP